MRQEAPLSHTMENLAFAGLVERLLTHSRLGPEEQHRLRTLPATRVQIAAHRDAVRLEEVADYTCVVEQGFLGRFGETEDGARQIVSVHVRGELVDLYSFMFPGPTTGLSALTPVTLLQVPHGALRELVNCFPLLAMALWRESVLQGAIGVQWLVNVGRRDARSRMAHFLCEMAVRLSDSFGKIGLRYELPITQEHLADMLGLTAVHVNRTLRGLRREGLVTVSRNHVEITDWESLSAAAEFNPSYLCPGDFNVSDQ
jgi:CRP-like cAMP-binding protein